MDVNLMQMIVMFFHTLLNPPSSLIVFYENLNNKMLLLHLSHIY
nr:MAG TPA: hypothetical protein [Caudoviricetes sp.]